MSTGRLLSAYAFEVSPRQEIGFVGGVVAVGDRLQAALDVTFERSRIAEGSEVTFEFDAENSSQRTHPVRDPAIRIAFSADADVAPAQALAARLASVMDHRSKPALLMVTVHESSASDRRRFLMWTFPQQDVFTLSAADGEANLEALEAFTRESTLRKLAMLDGDGGRGGMLTARVVDFQADATDRAAADFWVVKFLQARLQMSDAEGTRLLARALRTAHSKSRGDVDAQAEITDAITALRISPTTRWSIDRVASTYLTSQGARDALLNAVRPEERGVLFGVDKPKFDELVQFKRFVLANGVIVSAPFVEIGSDRGVVISEVNGNRRLQVSGQIEEEAVRSRG